jgi:phospholipid-binding lipoprotein MlaA
MSVSALTTAMAVAAATVPNGNAPASVDSSSSDSAAIVYDPSDVEIDPESEAASPLILAQFAAPEQLDEPGQASEPPESTDPASSTQTEPQATARAASQSQIIVTGRRPSPDDPLEEINATSYQATQKVDKAIVAPVAFAYEKIIPRPIRSGLRNFLRNLGEPITFLNFLLQLKPGKAAETLGRFAINTTLGVAGVVDIAKRQPFKLPFRRNGFANTLGYYGVKPGPYFYLPLIGSTTLRDFIGGRLDLLLLPTIVGGLFTKPKFAIPAGGLSELNYRIEFDDELSAIRAAQDPYVAQRTYYLHKRQAEIDALHSRNASTIKPPVPAPTSSDPAQAPFPPPPVQNHPQDHVRQDKSGASGIGGMVDCQPLDKGALSTFGTSG